MRRNLARTDSGIALIRAGLTLRDAAKAVGVANSTLVRACRRTGITLRRGRTGGAAPNPP